MPWMKFVEVPGNGVFSVRTMTREMIFPMKISPPILASDVANPGEHMLVGQTLRPSHFNAMWTDETGETHYFYIGNEFHVHYSPNGKPVDSGL